MKKIINNIKNNSLNITFNNINRKKIRRKSKINLILMKMMKKYQKKKKFIQAIIIIQSNKKMIMI